jgi:signal transduction histidine kinase
MNPAKASKPSLLLLVSLIIIVTVTVIMGFQSMLDYQMSKERIVSNLQTDASESAERLSHVLAPFLSAYAINDYFKVVENEIRHKHYFAIVVEDFNFAAITGEDAYVSGLIKTGSNSYAALDFYNDTQRQSLDAANYKTSTDITNLDHQTIGRITVYENEDILNTEITRLFYNTLLSALVTGLLLIGLLIFLSKRLFIHPLQTIVQTLDQKDTVGIPTQQIPDFRWREVSKLSHSIRQMLMLIRKSQDGLEQAVRERTAELELARLEAEQANFQKSRFLANMSHELRTPMHAIVNFARLGIKFSDNDKVTHYMDNIVASSHRLTELLNNLLDLSKLEAGKMPVNFAVHNLAETVSQTISELKPLFDEKQMHISFKPNQHIECEYDNRLISQVMVNLLSNANKYSPAKSQVSVVLSQPQPGRIRCCVSDQGIGIPDEEHQHVFDQFIQSSLTMSKAGGTGLGLPISREIISLHHGLIWVESPPGDTLVGSAFYFEIPVSQDTTGITSATQSAAKG